MLLDATESFTSNFHVKNIGEFILLPDTESFVNYDSVQFSQSALTQLKFIDK